MALESFRGLGFLGSKGCLGFNPGLFQLQRSDLFLAERQEREMSHSVANCSTNIIENLTQNFRDIIEFLKKLKLLQVLYLLGCNMKIWSQNLLGMNLKWV